MRAAVMEGPGKIRLRELPDPEPGPYEALCVLLHGAVCAGTDTHLVAGDAPFCHWFKYPAVLGHESIGRVVAVGERVEHLKPGDLVTRVGTPPVGEVNVAWGGFAELGIATDWRAMREAGVDAAQWRSATVQQVLPADTDPAEATMVITWRETLSFLQRAGCTAGQQVVIVGSGGNGLAFAAHARHLGAKPVVIGSATRRATAEALGATWIDYRHPNVTDALSVACDGPVHLAIDAVGKAGTLDAVLPRLAPEGRVAVHGLDELSTYRCNPMLAPGSFTFYNGGYDEAETHDQVVALMQAGKLDARHFLTNLDQPFDLAQIQAALDAVRTRQCVKSLVRLADG